MKINRAGIEEISRFAQVGGEDECWQFALKSLVKNGTGRLLYGQINRFGKNWRAHRFVAHLCGEMLTPDIFVCHTCDNPLCVNSAHLFLGSAADNVADKMAKGRHRSPVGENNGQAKISDSQARDVRRLALNGVKHKTIAEQYGISQALVSMIKNNKARVMYHENQ